MDSGLVSIIMPTYNCGRFIGESIQSVLVQTYTHWELIIVDDCSNDATATIVSSFADKRIRYYHNEHNSGAAITRNRALQEANGRWIAFLDSDDLWQPRKLEKQLAFMQQNNYAFSYHEYEEIDENGGKNGVYVSGKKHIHKWDMYSCCWPGCLSVMYDVQTVGSIQIADIKKNNDSAMWLQVIKKTDCYLLAESLALYRRRKGSITPTKITTKIRWHYVLFRQGEGMNPLCATFWMFMNILGNSYKKIFYVRKQR